MFCLKDLTCEYRFNPVGIESAHPRFGWVVESDEPDDYQTACQVLVASGRSLLSDDKADMWNSGKVECPGSIGFKYQGKSLSDKTIYYWKARAWNREQRASAYSPDQHFITGLSPNSWTANWIWDRPDAVEHQHRYFRRQFRLPDKTILYAVAYVSADEYYHLYVNGERAGMGPAPCFAEYQYYNTIDVTARLTPGTDNVLAAHVMYSHINNTGYTGGDNKMGFILQLEIVFADGERLTVKTDSNWKALVPAHTGCWGDEIIRGNELPDGWQSSGFNDSAWQDAVSLGLGPIPGKWDRLISQNTGQLRLHAVEPAEFVARGPRCYFVDFGREAEGYLKVRFKGGVQKQRVLIRFAEEKTTGTDLSDEPDIVYPLRCMSGVLKGRPEDRHQQIIYHVRATDEEVLDQQFDYMGFRYAQLYNATTTLTRDDVSMLVRTMYSPEDDMKSSFSSSSALLNKIWDLCKYTMKVGTEERYFDCPTRERGQYLGDAFIQSWANFYTYGHIPLTRKLLKNIIQEVVVTGIPVPRFVAPMGDAVNARAIDYAIEWIFILWNYYMFTGDDVLVAESYPHIKAMMDTFYQRIYVKKDWVSGPLEDGGPIWDWGSEMDDVPIYNPNIFGDTLFNSLYYAGTLCQARMADLLGHTQEAETCRSRADEVKTMINAPEMWTDTGYRNFPGANTSLHSNTIALWAGVVPDDRKPVVVGEIKRKGLYCGVYFAFFVLQALYQAGESEYALSLLEAPEEGNDTWQKTHRWSHMLARGATTTWESWDPIKYGRNMSLFHPWATCPAIIIPSDIMGIKPLAPGYRRILIRPNPGTLQEAEIQVPTLSGEVGVKFDHQQGKFRLKVRIPVNATARICVPSESEAGRVLVDGSEEEGERDGVYLCFDDIGSGTHEFEAVS